MEFMDLGSARAAAEKALGVENLTQDQFNRFIELYEAYHGNIEETIDAFKKNECPLSECELGE